MLMQPPGPGTLSWWKTPPKMFNSVTVISLKIRLAMKLVIKIQLLYSF